MFLRLKKNFKPIVHDDYFELFNNNTGRDYYLDADQYQLILSLNGLKTEQEILADYNKKSQLIVKNFLKELEKLDAIEKIEAPKIRQFSKISPLPYLETIIWDITSLCNLKCSHCYVSDYFNQKNGGDFTTSEVFKVIEEMVSMNVKSVALTGGEPLLREDIQDIIKRLIENDIHFAALFTNCMATTHDFVSFLKSLMPNKIQIYHSLDGMTPESNAVIRGDKRNSAMVFQKMIRSIKMFVEAGISVSVGTTIHRFNARDITKMYSFVKQLGVERWRITVPKPIGRFLVNQNKIMARWEDILMAYRQVIDLHLKEIRVADGEIIMPINLEIEQVFRTNLVVKTLNTFQKNDISCFYHKNRCSLKANGDIIPCGYFDDVIVGNVKNDGLRKPWESQKMQKMKHLCISEVSECQGCPILWLCGAGCRALAQKINGRVATKDSYACHQFSFFNEVVLPLFKRYGFNIKMSEKCSEFTILK